MTYICIQRTCIQKSRMNAAVCVLAMFPLLSFYFKIPFVFSLSLFLKGAEVAEYIVVVADDGVEATMTPLTTTTVYMCVSMYVYLVWRLQMRQGR